MLRACKLLLDLAFPLCFLLPGGIAAAQQMQGTVSFEMFPPESDTAVVSAERCLPPRAVRTSDASNAADRNPTDSTQRYYFYEPFPMEPGSFFLQIGASVSLVPLAEAEQEYPMPGLDIQCKWGVFRNVSLAASYSTSYYSHLFHTGLQVSTNTDRFSVGVANHVGIAYGYLKNVNLFDNVEAHGFFWMPVLRLGYRFDEFSVSCSFVMTYVFESDSRVNGSRAYVGPEKSINDIYCTWVVEQPFLKNVHLSIGLSMGYARTPYQSWMQYNTTDEWLFVPEFFFAVQL